MYHAPDLSVLPSSSSDFFSHPEFKNAACLASPRKEMAKPTDWLGSFIEEEIRLAISWKQDRQRLSHVKQDPNTRFSDDMSNFRSVASATLLPGDPKLQISKVLSTQDPVTVLVTDGFTQVRAILSASVVRTLEAEIDEEITLESKNDVFTVREVTVTTTSFGLAERFIQLEIDDIDYQYLLRKAVGQPVPVAQKEPIVGLIKIISDLRAQEYRVESDHQRPSPGSPSLGSGLDASRRSDHNLDDTPKSQNSQNFQRLPPQYSSPIAAIGSQSTQHPIATQVPVRRKRKAAALAEDGFETVDGVNMDLPTGLRVDSTKYKSPSSTEKQPNNGSKATLIELLGKHKSGQLQQAAQKSRNASEPAIEPAHEVERPIEPSPPAPGGRGIATESQIIAQREIERNASNSPRAKTKVPPIDYSRRKIPRDQQKLLDQASSWLPSLPGQQFPHPNVPIELLRRWNAQAASVLNRSISSDTSAQPPRNDEFAEISRSASVSSDEESSEDEEFSASQWPASPSQPKAALPPDSTMTSSTKASPVQVRPTFPDFSPTAQHRRVQQPQSTHSGSPHSIASGSHRALHAHSRPPSRSSRYLDNGGSRPSTAQSRNRSDRVNDSPARSSALQLKGSQLPSYGPNSPNELHRSPWRRESAEQFSSQQSKSRMQTTPGRVLVKGTQVPMNDDEDGMEMDVPRSLDEDPTLAHRKRRSEFFKNAQRRDW